MGTKFLESLVFVDISDTNIVYIDLRTCEKL